MKAVALGAVAELNPTKPKGLQPEHLCSFVPMEAVDDYLGAITKPVEKQIGEVNQGYTYFANDDVLFAKITPCMENGKCAIARGLVNNVGFGSTEFHVVRAREDAIPEWIYYFLRQENVRREAMRHMTGSAGQQRVPIAFLRDLLIPLPPLAEQQRIAGLLRRADRLRRLRRYALDVSAGYLQAVFVEMFFNQARPDWPIVTVAELAKAGKNTVRTGPFGSQLLHSEFVDEGIPVLGIDNIVQNRFVWAKSRFITQEKYRQLQRYTVFPDDVLITIMGTVGRCAVAPPDIPVSINTKHLCCITLDREKCLPTFLKWCFLVHPDIRRQLGIAGRGAIMPGLNMEIIKDLHFPLPPMALQQRLKGIADQSERLWSQQSEALRQAEHLFQALLRRAFQTDLPIGCP